LRQSPYELFSEAVHLYPPLLPIINQEKETHFTGKQAPKLSELCLHQGTVWMWNRPVYDYHDGGHLRIEMRFLPSGPTPTDMAANAALMIGLVEECKTYINELIPAIPFQAANYNFYRSAQYSLNTTLIWPNMTGSGCIERPITDIIYDYLPLAENGLRKLGVSKEEASYYLTIIEARLAQKQNGALWQRDMLDHLMTRHNKKQALSYMLEKYIDYSHHNVPVAEWKIN